jgi:hypothetical protein
MLRSKRINHDHGDEKISWREGDRVVDLVVVGSLPQFDSLELLTPSPCP